jgi:MYXO-CTERM domain-containing protein
MPSLGHEVPFVTLNLIYGLVEAKKSWRDVLATLYSGHKTAVIYAEDNLYQPEPELPDWQGMELSGEVASQKQIPFETPELKPGNYLFLMTGTNDADLYINVGAPATLSTYVCRPYTPSSNEKCEITLTSKAKIFGMIRGFRKSTYKLKGQVYSSDKGDEVLNSAPKAECPTGEAGGCSTARGAGALWAFLALGIGLLGAARRRSPDAPVAGSRE